MADPRLSKTNISEKSEYDYPEKANSEYDIACNTDEQSQDLQWK